MLFEVTEVGAFDKGVTSITVVRADSMGHAVEAAEREAAPNGRSIINVKELPCQRFIDYFAGIR